MQRTIARHLCAASLPLLTLIVTHARCPRSSFRPPFRTKSFPNPIAFDDYDLPALPGYISPSNPSPCPPKMPAQSAPVPPASTSRKRSRSPSDSDSQQHPAKRQNKGPDAANAAAAADRPVDVPMSEANNDSSKVNASTADVDKSKENLPPKPEPAKDSSASESGNSAAKPTPVVTIHMRCLIVTQDASIIIGKGGSHVNEIREKSGAKVMVSESIPGNPERILNVSGALDAVSKVRQVHTTIPAERARTFTL